MTTNEFYKNEKVFPYKSKTHSHTYVKDSDLQIDLSNSNESPSLESTVSFKAILSQYMGEVRQVCRQSLINQLRDNVSIKKAMEDAQTSYASMMQIHQELETAYNEFLRMQTL